MGSRLVPAIPWSKGESHGSVVACCRHQRQRATEPQAVALNVPIPKIWSVASDPNHFYGEAASLLRQLYA